MISWIMRLLEPQAARADRLHDEWLREQQKPGVHIEKIGRIDDAGNATIETRRHAILTFDVDAESYADASTAGPILGAVYNKSNSDLVCMAKNVSRLSDGRYAVECVYRPTTEAK